MAIYVGTALTAAGVGTAVVVGGSDGQEPAAHADDAATAGRDRRSSSPETTSSTDAASASTTPTSTTPQPTTTTTTLVDTSRDAEYARAGLATEADLPGWEPDDAFDLGAALFWGAPTCVDPVITMFAGVTGSESTLLAGTVVQEGGTRSAGASPRPSSSTSDQISRSTPSNRCAPTPWDRAWSTS